MKFHINPKGDATVCSAKKDNCPFGSEEDHYTSAAEALSAYEKAQETFQKSESLNPTFANFGDGWKDDPDNTYKKALKEAKKLKAEGKFVIISTSYASINENYEEEPVYEDFDDEEEYEEALEEWHDSLPDPQSTDDVAYLFPEGIRRHAAFSYESRAAFEESLKKDGIPGYGGGGETDGTPNQDESTDNLYKSNPEVGIANRNMLWYYEARVL